MTSTYLGMPAFPEAAKSALANAQLRNNLANATGTIRGKRQAVVDELSDWHQLREAGAAIKAHTLSHLDTYLEQFEAAVQMTQVGQVLEVGDGIARIHGLSGVMAGEMVVFQNGVRGMAFNLE